jgi:hypothetical protein
MLNNAYLKQNFNAIKNNRNKNKKISSIAGVNCMYKTKDQISSEADAQVNVNRIRSRIRSTGPFPNHNKNFSCACDSAPFQGDASPVCLCKKDGVLFPCVSWDNRMLTTLPVWWPWRYLNQKERVKQE